MIRPGGVHMRVLRVIKNQFGTDIDAETHLAEDLRIDSLDRVLIVMALEDEFDIELEDGDFDDICTVQQVIDYMLRVA